jgi:translation elongation factor P/translation initiation factor 5A
MPSANDLRKGQAIKYNNDICIVLDMQHRTPGNLRAFVQATLRSVKTGKSSVVRFISTETMEMVSKNTRYVDFSYKDQGGYHFMDPETYETITLNDKFIGDSKNYLTENLRCTLTEIEGKVAEQGYNGVFGNFVILTHPEGLQTLYGHLSSIAVRTGQSVSQSTVIGFSGNSGYSTGPHMHFGLFRRGAPLNPLKYLK